MFEGTTRQLFKEKLEMFGLNDLFFHKCGKSLKSPAKSCLKIKLQRHAGREEESLDTNMQARGEFRDTMFWSLIQFK